MPIELAKNIDEEVSPIDKPDKQDPLNKPENSQNIEGIDKHKLTAGEVKDLEEERTTVKQLVAKREQLKAAAQAELTSQVRDQQVVDLDEFKKIQKAIDGEQSPQKMQELLDRIKELPKTKEEKARKEQEEAKELSPEDSRLIELQKKFEKLCDDNKDLIGLKQVEPNKRWIDQERHKTPTIKHLKDILTRMEGRDTKDKGGLFPRREEYDKLTTLFKKYGLSSPQECDYIRQEGLSERRDFRQKIEDIEDFFETRKDTGFYSREMIQARMKENLKTKNPDELARNLQISKNVAKKEDEGFTYFDQTINVGGTTIKKMSDTSKKEFLDYYKNATFSDREKVDFKNLVENEGKLAKDLEKIYTDAKTGITDKEGLKLALGSFEHMDFLKKQDALKYHEELVRNSGNKETRDRELTLKAAFAKIDDAAEKNIIAKGGEQSTQGRYRKFFQTPDNFKNPQTGKPGDVEEMKKAYDILISPTPQEKHKNLAAYKARHDIFMKDLKKLQEMNPNISQEELQKWQDKYDKGSWTDREHLQKTEFPTELFKQKQDALKRKQIEDKVGIKEDSKSKDKVVSLELSRTIKAAQELISNDQGAEAMKLLLEYNEKEPDNPKILFWIETAGRYMKEFGTGKKKEKTMEKELETKMERISKSDEHVRQGLQKAQVFDKNIKGAQQSEQRHNRKIDAAERSQEESLSRMQVGSTEADLTKDFYKQTRGEGSVLNKEGTGEKVRTIQFKENSQMTNENLQKLRKSTEKEQTKLDTKEGMAKVEVKDKTGKIVSAKEIGARLQEQEEEKLAKEIAAKAQEDIKRKSGQRETAGAKVFDLNAEVMARRKAQELIEERKHERIKNAA